MYWPVGPTKVYALSKHAFPRSSTTQSDDGIEDSAKSSSSRQDGHSLDSDLNKVSLKRQESNEGDQSKPSTNGNANGRDVVARESEILDAKPSRGGSIFVTITRSSITVWQAKPVVALASVVRSARSMKAYGPNLALLFRPDAQLVMVQTLQGYLISYSLATDAYARVYTTQLPSNSSNHARKGSVNGYSSFTRSALPQNTAGPGEGEGIKEVNLRFRMVMRIDAGISSVLGLDDELVVATQKPAALQCIKWISDDTRAQASTELVSKMSWVTDKCTVTEMIHDRPMNLSCWITRDGRAYAVQRRSASDVDMDNPASLFRGYCFRHPETDNDHAAKVCINARFSLIAVGCDNGQIDVHVVKEYMSNIPLSYKLQLAVSPETSGKLTCLTYSPDGYCLFAGYEHGWAMWSVYGKAGANSFGTDRLLSNINGEAWLLGIKGGFWTAGGAEMVLHSSSDDRLWVVEFARHALTSCYSAVSINRALLHSGTNVMYYQGHDVTDLTALPSDMSLWHSVPAPQVYLLRQWPIKNAVTSQDGKYIAVAGRRGLAHFSTVSGRWRAFDDPEAENEFAIRGGMCWYQHFLIACVEAGNVNQIRVFSREKSLSYSNILFSVALSAPAIFAAVSGTDSLLVYTYDNTLLHFIIAPSATSLKLVQVGQIGFHGIIRAPPRVRAISWILPEDQLEHGDPSQDVARASVLFLVDGKLVLLQPSANEQGELKYDMRVIAHNVEYYSLTRDCPDSLDESPFRMPGSAVNGNTADNHLGHGLRDSLWYFDGCALHVWSEVQDVLASAPADLGRDLPGTVRVSTDFYPSTAMVGKGIVNGLDAEFVQRRDVNLSYSRTTPRTSLFLPQLLRQHLADFNSPAALHLSQSYQHLPYFSHALEILLHDILDSEVDNPPPPEAALLPSAISFISSFPDHLDIIVNCTRKTELRSWRTLFYHLPPVLELFEQSLAQNKLKTAAGYLLVLHTFEDEQFQVHEFARLLRRASEEEDWELCREVARFLVGIDGTGDTLRAALTEAGLSRRAEVGSLGERMAGGVAQVDFAETAENAGRNGGTDYFSLSRQESAG